MGSTHCVRYYYEVSLIKKFKIYLEQIDKAHVNSITKIKHLNLRGGCEKDGITFILFINSMSRYKTYILKTISLESVF